jgi:glycosyltransferase involved in cell wall biosynthesis
MPENRLLSVSIIIPAFNEEKTIQSVIKSVCQYCDQQGFLYEVIVVNDGSQDQTVERVNSLLAQYPILRLLDNGTNFGKGYSVRHGMLRAIGELAIFMDADNSTKITELNKVLAKYNEGYGVIIGSRRVLGAKIIVHQSMIRELFGRLVNLLIRIVTGINSQDTQAGFKAFSRSAREIIFPLQRLRRWLFDAELLVISQENQIPVAEIPITWENNKSSRVKLFHLMTILKELIVLWLNQKRGLYKKHY